MKIITASKFYYMRAGLESYLFKISELLRDSGHIVVPFSTKHPSTLRNPFLKYFINYYELGGEQDVSVFSKLKALSNIYYNVEAEKSIARLIEDEEPDLLWGFGVHRHLSPSVFMAAKKLGVPVIHRLSDYALICPNSKLFFDDKPCAHLLCPSKGYSNAVSKQCVSCGKSESNLIPSIIGASELFLHNKLGFYKNNVDKFISPSKFHRAVMIKSGFNQDKIVHVPIFIDAEKYKPQIKAQDFYVYFGRLSEEKGLLNLLKAAKINREHKLIIIGDGPQREILLKYKEQNRLNNVFFAGKLHGEKLFDIVKNSRFVVVPSIWYDNSPNVILEAYACAKPVLAAKIGGIPEYVEDNETGFLYQYDSVSDLAQKIGYMMTNKLSCMGMGVKARLLAINQYSPELHYQRVEEVIKSVT